MIYLVGNDQGDEDEYEPDEKEDPEDEDDDASLTMRFGPFTPQG